MPKVELVDYSVVSVPVIDKCRDRRLIGPCSVVLNTNIGTYKVIIPVGFVTDGISGTRLTHKVLPRWKEGDSKYNACGLVHDILYEFKGFGIFTRKDCDNIFKGMLHRYGVNKFVCNAANLLLNIFAGCHWGADGYNTSDAAHIRRL